MRLIPAGSFIMGSSVEELYRDNDEGPLRNVRINTSYYLGVHEVTQGEWKEVMGTTPWSGQSYVQIDDNSPATYVSWADAQAFCQALSASDGKTYRLPTEAEWEYACRAGSATAYSFGDSSSFMDNYAWSRSNAEDVNQQYPHDVGLKQANAWGLHDMHGNVWELCQDWYSNDYEGASLYDPTGPSTGEHRVIRGGSWDCNPWSCRAAFRNRHPSDHRCDVLGFRIVCLVE